MSPLNCLCWSERNPALDTHGDNAYSPQIPDTKLTVTSKVQFLQLQHVSRQKCKKHNPSLVQRHTLPSQLLITQFRLNKHNLPTSLAAPKANPIFHAANKNLFTKTHFVSRHLTSSSFYLLFLTTNQLLQLNSSNKNSGYKMVPLR